MPLYVAYILGFVFAIAATVAAYIFVVPAKKRDGLNNFLKWVHDLCQFKSLMIEQILKALYIFNTALVIIAGFFMLFVVEGIWLGWMGLLFIIFGPIFVRLTFEGLMLGILLLKNTMEINDKLVPQSGSRAEEKLAAERRKKEEEAARANFAQQYAQQQYQYQQQQYPQYPGQQ